MYTLTHLAYCGMTTYRETFDERDEARAAAAAYLARARRRFPVTTVERGRVWEVLEPEGAASVPDACGALVLDRRTFACRECGCEHDTRERAAECCTFWDEYADTSEGAEA